MCRCNQSAILDLNQNLLAWFGFEETVRQLSDELEGTTDDDDEEDSDEDQEDEE
jgi:hypothetical protein